MDLDNCRALNFEPVHAQIESNITKYGHKAVLLGKNVVVWGGHVIDETRVFFYDIINAVWTSFSLKNSAVGVGAVDVMFLDNDRVCGLTFELNFTDWRMIIVDAVLLEEYRVVDTFNPPMLVAGGAGAFLEEGRELVLLGGYKKDLDVLNIDSRLWYQPITSGKPPPKRRYHACCAYKNVLYFAGGDTENETSLVLHVLDVRFNRFRWSTPKGAAGTLAPQKRRMHTMTCAGPNRIFVLGGYSQTENGQVAIYSFRKGGWMGIKRVKHLPNGHDRLHFKGSILGGTAKHAAVQTQDFLLVIGGYRTQFKLRDLLKIRPWY